MGKFGSLFEGIFSKSPDVAKRLKDMAKSNSDTPPSPSTTPEKPETKNTSTEKTSIDRMANVVVEKRKIAPRTRIKPTKSRPAKEPAKETNKSQIRARNNGGNKKLSPTYANSFFEGIPENAHQFGENDKSQILDIVLGLDFGTSSTKVVVHAPNYVGNPAFAIPFGIYAHPSLEHLLPTRLGINSAGECSLSLDDSSTVLTDIKISLMRSPQASVTEIGATASGATSITATISYLALVFRYVRGWFLAHKKSIFQNFRINWSVNLGLPAAIDDNPSLRETFDLAGKAAWLISQRAGPITLKCAYGAIQDIKFSRFDENELPWDFALIPEVIAEVTGYARSELRNHGLHFLIDVGASTLDVCAFTLMNKKGDDHFPIFTAEVALLGAQQLHRTRVNGVVRATTEKGEKLIDNWLDPLSIIPNDLSSYIPDNDEMIDAITTANDEFIKDASYTIRKTIWHTKTNRDPRSPQWSEKLRIFVCGGAKDIGTFNQIIVDLESWLKRVIPGSPGIRIIALPKPTSLEANINEEDYHRLAVAWGLSHEIFNIGSYDRPSEIDDIPRRRIRDISENFVSKDQV